jgi:hypothetical protein
MAAMMELALEPPYLIVKPFASEEDFYRGAHEDSAARDPEPIGFGP